MGHSLTPPWRLANQRFVSGKQPDELHLEVVAERGSLFPCLVCGKLCKAHDFAEVTWRHLDFFQYHWYITAKLPRADCASTACRGLPSRGRARAATSPCCSSRRP